MDRGPSLPYKWEVPWQLMKRVRLWATPPLPPPLPRMPFYGITGYYEISALFCLEAVPLYDVNNLSQVVGNSYSFGVRRGTVAFLWDQGVMYDLNTLLDATGVGWHVDTARGINDLGQIVGTAYHPSHGQRGVLLTPTTSPEPTVAFATFTAKLELKLAPRIDDTFDLESRFTLGTGSNGIDPQTEDVTLELKHGTASFTTTIPAGSFTKDKQGYFTVKETVDGVKLDARLTSLGGQQYAFTAEGKHTDLTDIATPVTVTLTIGDDSGSTAVTASLKGQGQRVANGQ